MPKKSMKETPNGTKLLKWAQKNFDNFRVVPPESGICHQVNLEYLATVVSQRKTHDGTLAFPDTLVGTDSPHHHDQCLRGIGLGGSAALKPKLSCWDSPII